MARILSIFLLYLGRLFSLILVINIPYITGFTLVPSLLRTKSLDEASNSLEFLIDIHKDDLPFYDTFYQELSTWHTKWKQDESAPSELRDAYIKAEASSNFPNIAYLLKLMLTIPVTSASVERANSTLKFIKTNLRSRLSEDHLNAFVLCYKHQDLMEKLNYSELTKTFIRMKTRRLRLTNPCSE